MVTVLVVGEASTGWAGASVKSGFFVVIQHFPSWQMVTVFVTMTGSEVYGTMVVIVLHSSFSQTTNVFVWGASVVTAHLFASQMVTVFVTQEPLTLLGSGVTTVHLSFSQTVTVLVNGIAVGSQGMVLVKIEQLPKLPHLVIVIVTGA